MTAPPAVDRRRLGWATLGALGIAAAVLLVAVLPAEYGIDPTGLGRLSGFSRLSEAPPEAAVQPPADPSVALYEMRASWRLVELPLAQREGYVGSAENEARVTVPLRIANLTRVTATLAWNDTDRIGGELTGGDTLEVSIRGPNGTRSPLAQATNLPGEAANVSASVAVREVPFPQNATGRLILETEADTRGVGEWTFVVRLYSARGAEGSAEPDPGQAWTLRVTGEAYELDVATQAERFGDRVELTLPPRGQVEYKLEMEANATMDYRWRASGPVHADLHADRFEDPDAFLTTKVATLSADEGSYTAPFHGRHGWYWRNDGSEPVTIVLETRGAYRILGVV